MSNIQEPKQSQNQDIQQKYNNLMLDYNQIKDQLKIAEENDQQVLIDLSNYQRMIDQLKNQLNQSMNTNSQNNCDQMHQQQLKEIQKLENSIILYQQKKDKIQSQIILYNQETSNSSIQNLQNNKQELAQKIHQVEAQIATIGCQSQFFDNLKQKIKRQYTQLTFNLQSAQKQQEQFNLHINSCNQQRLILEAKIKQIDEQIEESKKTQAANKKILDKLQSKQLEFEDYSNVKNELSQQIKRKKEQQSDQKGKAVVSFNKSNQTQQKLNYIQKQIKQLQKDHQEIKRKMKQEINKSQKLKQGGQKGMKKNKNKNKNQLKEAVFNLQKENSLLQIDLDRQNKKLDDLVQLQKTYGDPQQIHQLKNQYNQKSNIEIKKQQELKKNKKLYDQNKNLKESVQFLKDMTDKHYKQKQASLSQVNHKLQHKRKVKIDIEMEIQQSRKRLQIYESEFPNHQIQKLEKKNQLKKQKMEKQLIKKQSKQDKKPKKKETRQKDQLQQKEQLPFEQPKQQSFISKLFSRILPN